ncbi:hypothetical protein Bca101_057701 [Brassica carinata]
MKINQPRRDEKQELTVVALGHLAIIALTVQLEPEFSKNVGQIVLLGGPFTVNRKGAFLQSSYKETSFPRMNMWSSNWI